MPQPARTDPRLAPLSLDSLPPSLRHFQVPCPARPPSVTPKQHALLITSPATQHLRKELLLQPTNHHSPCSTCLLCSLLRYFKPKPKDKRKEQRSHRAIGHIFPLYTPRTTSPAYIGPLSSPPSPCTTRPSASPKPIPNKSPGCTAVP